MLVDLELVSSRVYPVDRPWDAFLPLSGMRTAPFAVERVWAGPAGQYREEWLLREGGEIILRGAPRRIKVWGIQSISKFTDVHSARVRLGPGEYELVFMVEGEPVYRQAVIATYLPEDSSGAVA